MYFLDTNILLNYVGDYERFGSFAISSVSIEELERIKSDKYKSDDVKRRARDATRWLLDNIGSYTVVLCTNSVIQSLRDKSLPDTPDNRIIACCKLVDDDVVFVSEDVGCLVVARSIFKFNCAHPSDNTEEYTGFLEVSLNDEEMAGFYENLNKNLYNLLINQYVLIKNSSGEIVDQYRWDGYKHQPIKIGNLKSDYFGSVKPYKGDIYQQLALNSMMTNKVTMLKGKAGTGKSYLALGYLFYLMDKKKIDRIICFCNTVATINAAKLGYLPGDKDEKLLDSSIGNMLSAKLGGNCAVERLIDDGKLVLLPMSDIRGYDTTDMNAGVYITEAQNMDISLMKLALQRIGEDCICIIDGDYNAQVDLASYAGYNNGMRRMSEVFRGQDFYGEVELQNIYRSRIANIAERM